MDRVLAVVGVVLATLAASGIGTTLVLLVVRNWRMDRRYE